MYSRDAQQAAYGFLTSQISHIEPQVLRVLYPDIQYPRLIPVDTSAPEWAKSVTFFSVDRVGRADWFHHQATDMALADITRDKFEQGIEMAGIGYRYTLEELGQAMMIPGLNLSPEKANAARRASEEFVDDKALRGDAAKSWYGLLNADTVVTVVTAPATGTGSSPFWTAKTGDQIVQDINDTLSGIYTTSLQVEMADTILVPVGVLAALASRRMDANGSDINILEWVKRYNVYTLTTGQPLTIMAVRGLENAAVGGDGGRMVAYRRDPQVLKLHMPMPHRFLPVWQRGPITFDVPGIMRFGGLEIRRPGSVRYLDQISSYSS
jgi:hypothetical protein